MVITGLTFRIELLRLFCISATIITTIVRVSPQLIKKSILLIWANFGQSVIFLSHPNITPVAFNTISATCVSCQVLLIYDPTWRLEAFEESSWSHLYESREFLVKTWSYQLCFKIRASDQLVLNSFHYRYCCAINRLASFVRYRERWLSSCQCNVILLYEHELCETSISFSNYNYSEDEENVSVSLLPEY